MATDEGKTPEGGQETPKEPAEPKGAKPKQKPPKKGGGVPGWAVAVIVIVVIAVIAGIAVGVVMALSGGGENQAPTITSLTANPPSVTAGHLSTITCVASDPDGDTLDYDWEYTGGELQGSGTTRTWIAPNVEGTFTVTVTVDDGNGGTDQDSVAIVVANAPTPTPTPTPTSTATPAPSDGSLDIKSNPSGAAVYIDGVDTGSITPYTIAHISAGNHVVKLEMEYIPLSPPPYYDWRIGTVAVIGGETTYINWALDIAPTQSVTIQPDATDGKDTHVYEGDPSDNRGLWTTLFPSGDAAGQVCRTYIQFDISSIPSTAVILSANISLYYDSQSGTSVAGPVGVYRVTGSWDEAVVTWDVQPSVQTTPLDTVTMPASATSSFLSWDIKTLVQRWVEGAVTNNGVALMDTDESTFEGWKQLVSSDSATDVERPKLAIQYYDPAP